MFTHEYNDNGDHCIVYKGPEPTRYHTVEGNWYPYTVPARLELNGGVYLAFSTYTFPTRSSTHSELQYPGPYADTVYQVKEV